MRSAAAPDLMTMTINDIIQTWPGTVAVFNVYGVDACCGGSLALGAVAARHGIEPDVLTGALLAVARDEADKSGE
jgi:iron-sulfur cluster repair protein YtfE (RIC family)